jgi:hypothetical protein
MHLLGQSSALLLLLCWQGTNCALHCYKGKTPMLSNRDTTMQHGDLLSACSVVTVGQRSGGQTLQLNRSVGSNRAH